MTMPCKGLGIEDRIMRNALLGRFRWSVMVVAVVGIAGCAPRRPVLYPNTHLEDVGAVAAERDIAECRQLAAARASSGRSGDVARSTVVGGGTGAAAGAVGGAIWGDAGRGAAAGAAVGATVGVLQAVLNGGESTEIYRNFVAACLSDRGYRVIGWE